MTMMVIGTSDATAADCSLSAKTQGVGIEAHAIMVPAEYSEALVKHWAEAFVDGPMKNIARYDEAAKLLVTLVIPLQAALFTLYDKVGGKLDGTPFWFTELLLVLFPVSVSCVVFYVVRVCNKRPRLKINLPCQDNNEVGLISHLLRGAVNNRISSEEMTLAVESWETHIEDVADCKHRWLTYAFYGFVAGALFPSLVLLLASALFHWAGGNGPQ